MAEDPDAAPDVERVLTEFLAARARGAAPDADEWAARLHEAATRAEFLELVAESERVFALMPSQLRAGDRLLDRYELVAELGAGGFGKVWRARDLEGGEDVAVKVLNARAVDQDARSNLRRDRAALQRLRHPGVVGIRADGEVDGAPFLVLDLVDGVSARDVLLADEPRLAAVPAPFREAAGGSWWAFAAGVVEQLATTLAAAHAANVLHRDIKPDNVMLRRDGQVVLLDFGLCGMLDGPRGSLTARLIGTVHYLAPEQCREQRLGSDPRVDVYQLGVVFYELLLRRPAIAPELSIHEILSAVQLGAIAPPSEVDPACPAALAAICRRATEVAPSRRYQDMAAFAEDLTRWREGRAPAQPLSTWTRAARPSRRRAGAVAAAVGALALGALAVLATMRLLRDDPAGLLVQDVAVDGARVTLRAEVLRPGVLFGVALRSDDRQRVVGVLPLTVRSTATFGKLVGEGALELEFTAPRAVDGATPCWLVVEGAERSLDQQLVFQSLQALLLKDTAAPFVPTAAAVEAALRHAPSAGAMLGEGWAGR